MMIVGLAFYSPVIFSIVWNLHNIEIPREGLEHGELTPALQELVVLILDGFYENTAGRFDDAQKQLCPDDKIWDDDVKVPVSAIFEYDTLAGQLLFLYFRSICSGRTLPGR